MNRQHYSHMIAEFLTMKPKGNLEAFLKAVLTPKETEEIALRVQIINKLLEGKSQQKIAKELKVGVATVTRGAFVTKQDYFKRIEKLWW